MKKISIFLLMGLLSCWSCRALPVQMGLKSAKPSTKAAVVDENTNIHFTGRYCSECHVRTPVKGGDPYLKYNGDYRILCGRCHHGMSPGYCHPLDIDIKTAGEMNFPPGFPLKDGKFTCNTCHDVYRQCRKRLFDRYTLRGAPYPRKTDFCYRCHSPEKYPRLNAHHQVLADGSPDSEMCLYCHAGKPDEKKETYQQVSFIGNMGALCLRCHAKEGNHPGDFDHLKATPPAKALEHMADMETTFGIILPLGRDGKMTCATCHNPHEKGVVAAGKPAAKGAGGKFRLRLPGKLCITCHQM